MTTEDKRPRALFETRAVENPYPHEGERPALLWYLDGPGSPGFYGATLNGSMYWDTAEEAKRAIPMMTAAYHAGVAAHKKAVREAMDVVLGRD